MASNAFSVCVHAAFKFKTKVIVYAYCIQEVMSRGWRISPTAPRPYVTQLRCCVPFYVIWMVFSGGRSHHDAQNFKWIINGKWKQNLHIMSFALPFRLPQPERCRPVHQHSGSTMIYCAHSFFPPSENNKNASKTQYLLALLGWCDWISGSRLGVCMNLCVNKHHI